jgi:tetratricopeptide (TPR) repeat protein
MSRLPRNGRALLLSGLLLLLGLLYPDLAALGRPGKPVPTLLEQGERYLSEGRFFRAEVAFLQALSSPGGEKALGRLGLLALLRGEENEARERLRAAVQLQPDDRTAWACLGWLEANRGELSVAQEIWAQGLVPGDSFLIHGLRGELAYRRRSMEDAREEFLALLAADAPPPWRAWAHLRLGTLAAPSDPGAALAQWRAALHPGGAEDLPWTPSPELLFGMPAGEAARRAEELAGVLDALSQSEKPTLALAQVLIGQQDGCGAAYLLEQGREPVAEATSQAYLGYALFLCGEATEGLRALHQARILAPGDPLVRHLLARVYLDRGWLRAARGELERLLEISPEDPLVMLDFARLAQQEGLYEEADAWISQAWLAAAGGKAEPFLAFLRARFYLESGWSLCDKGKEAVEELLLRLSNEPETWRAYGRWLTQCGKPADAITALQRAVEMDPTSAEAYEALGLAYLAAGDRSSAARAFLEAADREPWGAASHHARAWLQAHPTALVSLP